MRYLHSLSQEQLSSRGGSSLDSNMYVIWMELGGNIYLYDTWLDSLLAVEECKSLNERDANAFYYITFMGARL